MDLAIESEAIQSFEQAPFPGTRLTLNPKNLVHPRPIFHQNRADLNGWWHSPPEMTAAGDVSSHNQSFSVMHLSPTYCAERITLQIIR
jgi:hypothetical protein